MYFEVTFTNGVDDLVLLFKTRKTNIAKKWFSELRRGYELYEVDRLDNWGLEKHHFIDLLNQQIDIINNYDAIVDKRVTDNVNQQELNYLHKFFEDLRGEVVTGTPWYHTAPEHVQLAVDKFNVVIHQLETVLKNTSKYPTATITFKDRPRLELYGSDFDRFTFKWKRGTVYINYCQVGKTLLDVYNDKDHIAKAIRPQTHYSADMMIRFGPSTNLFVYIVRWLLVQRWIKKRCLFFNNPSLGMIPVADLVTKVDNKTLIKYNRVKSVCTK